MVPNDVVSRILRDWLADLGSDSGLPGQRETLDGIDQALESGDLLTAAGLATGSDLSGTLHGPWIAAVIEAARTQIPTRVHIRRIGEA